MSERRKRRTRVGILALLGGAAIIVGCLLPWVSTPQGVVVGTTSIGGELAGTVLKYGQAAVAAGATVVLLGFLLLVLRRGTRFVGLLLMLGGGVAIAASSAVLNAPQDRYIAYAAETGAPTDEVDAVTRSLQNLFAVNDMSVDPGTGLYVAVGGGALALIAGFIALVTKAKLASEPELVLPEPEPAPSGYDPAPESEPVSPEPEPVAPESEPVAPESEPVSPEPEPVAPEPEPVAPEPEPVAPEPEPVAPEPEPVAPEPEPVAPEPEPVAPEPPDDDAAMWRL